MKIGTKVTIPMGLNRGPGVIVAKKGTSANADQLAIKTLSGKVIVISKVFVKKAL